MTLEAFLRRVLEVIEAVGIPYMLTGSIAVAYHGDPRATRDLDVVIVASPEDNMCSATWARKRAVRSIATGLWFDTTP